METKTILLDNEEGLHARPAAKFVEKQINMKVI